MPPTKRRASVAAAMAEAAAMDGYDDLRPSKHAGVKRLSDELTCEICEGVLRDPATLPCCHTFCLACVEDKLQGHGVYESKCPQCGMPLHFKDLRVNQTYNGVIEQIESALARFAAESTRVEEKDADARVRESARTPETDASLALAVPTPARCRELASDVRSIDAALAFLAARLETAMSANEKRKRETSPAPRDQDEDENVYENARSASETLPSPTPIYVSYRDTQNTDPNGTFRSDKTRHNARGSRASLNTPCGTKEKQSPTVSVAATNPPSPPSPPKLVASATPRGTSRVRRLTAPQARRLYAAAHGKPPPKRLTHALKKLLAELEKLDDELVEQLIEIALRDERDETNDDDDDASFRVEKKQTSEPPDAATTTQNADERDGRSLSRARGSRVFAYAYAAPSTSARSASLGGAWGKRKAAALAEAVARANDATKKAGGDPTGIEPATAAANAEGFPARATHLLMDVDETNTFVRSRTVKYLEAVARGAWVLPFSYLERCAEANRWLPERDFELEDLGRGRRAEDGSWVAPGRSDDDEVRDETKALAVFGVGPAGGRRRVAAGAPGAFAGEVVAVASAPARLLVAEMERLLLAGGAEAVLCRAPGALGRGTPRGKTRNANENENENDVGDRFCETEIPESVPDSQASAEEETDLERFGWAEGATAVVDGGDGSGVAVGRALGVPVVDWHWVFHSLVYHAPLPKKEYEAVESFGTRGNQT
jgi:hypothetical protein